MWDPNDTGAWWHQRSSFRERVVPPSSQPCDSPLVCISINQSWIPYIVGSVTQLAQPSTWKVDSEAELADVLERVQDIIAILGEAMPCVSPSPLLPGISTAQRGCNIAGYIANVVIKQSIQKAIDSINQNLTVLGYGKLIIFAIPGIGFIFPALISGLYGLYNSMVSGTLSDYQDAVNDPTLWSQVTCAIYNAISIDGQVTDLNFPTIQANVAAVSYVHAEVITVISQYTSDLGATGLEQLQNTGALAVYDCSACGTGISTGPSGLPPQRAAGTVGITIAAHSGSNTATVTFDPPFTATPVVIISCEDPVLVASASGITATGFTAELISAVDVDVDTTAEADWQATLPGGSL